MKPQYWLLKKTIIICDVKLKNKSTDQPMTLV